MFIGFCCADEGAKEADILRKRTMNRICYFLNLQTNNVLAS